MQERKCGKSLVDEEEEEEEGEETCDSFDIAFKNHYLWIKNLSRLVRSQISISTKCTSAIDVYIFSGLKRSC